MKRKYGGRSEIILGTVAGIIQRVWTVKKAVSYRSSLCLPVKTLICKIVNLLTFQGLQGCPWRRHKTFVLFLNHLFQIKGNVFFFPFLFMVVVQPLSHVRLFVTPWTAACQISLSFTVFQTFLRFMSIESVMPFKHLILSHPLLLLPSIFPSIRVFSDELGLHIRWPEYWSFSISPSSEYSGLTSFRSDWFDLPAIQETLKSLVQHHSMKASILWFLLYVPLSHLYMTAGKTIALTIWTFVGKVMSLLFNALSRFVIAFLPRNQASFNFMAAVIICNWFWSPGKENLSPFPLFPCFPTYEVMGSDVMILVFFMFSLKPAFSLSSFTLIEQLFSSCWLSAVRILTLNCAAVCHFTISTCVFRMHPTYINPKLSFFLIWHTSS